MLNTKLKLTLGLAVLAAATALAQTQTNAPAGATSAPPTGAPAAIPVAATPAPPPPTAFDNWANEVKNPVGWFSWGGDMRVRNEYFDNAVSLTPNAQQSPIFAQVHEQDYFRFRGRLWASIFPTNDLTFNVRLAAEPREFMKPSTMDTYLYQSGMQWRYGIIDTLNVQWKKPLDLPATLTVGRQDVFLGDGWLVGDCTPEDGSFTSFLDSARITWDLKEQHTTIDAIALVQYARPDAWLPTIGPSTAQGANPEPLLLTDQNEKGFILWVANKTRPAANLDAFFLYKHDTRINDYPEASFGDNADIYTIGGQISGLLEDHWKYSVEGAYQFGRKADPELVVTPSGGLISSSQAMNTYHDIVAYGLNSKLTYLLKDPLNNQFSLSFELLSGDNPKTGNDEMFDVLWGRWPRWSELYVYGFIAESRPGQIGNLIRLGPTWNVNPIKAMDFSLSYYALFADVDTPTRPLNQAFGLPAADTPFSNNGNFRGHYLQSILKYKFTKHLSGLLMGEVLFPGDYYASRNVMDFVRAEVMYTF